MITIYRSLTTKKRIVLGSRFRDGRIRVYIQNVKGIREPLYVLMEASTKEFFRLSFYGIVMHFYPKKDILEINKWPGEFFKKISLSE